MYGKTRYLVLFHMGKYIAICDRIRCHIESKAVISYIFSRNYSKIESDSDNGLPLQKSIKLA